MTTQKTDSRRAEIAQYRRLTNRDAAAHERRQLVTDKIVKDLLEDGTFFKAPEGHFYFNRSEPPRLFPIAKSIALEAFINERYGINPAEDQEFRHIISGLEIEAEVRGEKVEVRRLAHFNRDTRTLYVSRFDGCMFRLYQNVIEQVPNGTDGVFFWDDPGWEPFKMVPAAPTGLVDKLIFHSANFSEADGLTKFEQGWIFYAWCLAQFFGSLHPTKPLLLICGEKGGGKTLCLRKWLKLLFGTGADVTALERGKQDGFVAAVCSSPIAVFDNVDEHVSWLPDHLAQLATGIKFMRRKYYTTNETVEFQPNCFVALTSRTPKFIDGRDDVLDRTLVLHTKRRANYSPENAQLQLIATNRDALWSELLSYLSHIVAYLGNDKLAEEYVRFRMADFASFAMLVGSVRGQTGVVRSILEKLDSVRSDMLLSEDPVCVCLESWLKEPKNHLREITSGDLNSELGVIAKGEKIGWRYENGRALAQRLAHIVTNLEQRFGVKIGQDSAKQKLYSFFPKTETLNQTDSSLKADSEQQVPISEDITGKSGITESLPPKFKKNEYCKDLGQNDSAIQAVKRFMRFSIN
jgi:hypothetical protein